MLFRSFLYPVMELTSKFASPSYFPYFDTKALDAARFFYGNADCEITVQEGNTNLTQFFSEEDAFANMGEEIQEGSRNKAVYMTSTTTNTESGVES